MAYLSPSKSKFCFSLQAPHKGNAISPSGVNIESGYNDIRTPAEASF
jgi:hypothetical protein